MTLTSKDEYLKASNRLATGFGPTVDFTDGQIGTTSQSEDGIPTSASDLPGQVFSVDQLPDPAIAVAYGLPPVRIPEHLILDNEEDSLRHVQGKDALDVINSQLRAELGDPALAFDNTIRSQSAAHTSLTDRTGENAFSSTGALVDDETFVNGIKGGTGDETSTSGAEGPIDPEGVQRDPVTGEPVSAEAGTQGDSNKESGPPEQQKDPDEKPNAKAKSRG